MPHYVLSRSLTESQWSNTHFLRDLGEVAALKKADGRDLYLMGGGEVVRCLIDQGLVDELRLITYPIIAGGHNSLFGSGGSRLQAELVTVRTLSNGLVRSDYRL